MFRLAVSLFFTFISIHAAIAGQNTVKKYINSSMITIAYHKNFPYKKSYDKNLIPGCKKIYTNKPLLYCKEYVQLMRPVTLIKKWQDTQKKIGYLPITLPEFNIFNVAGEIISIIPAATYSKYLLSETNSTGHMVTGKFIRHSDKVGRYVFVTGKDSVIDKINATDNHLFYVKNRDKFIPVSKIQPTDSLINKDGKTVHLKHTVNSKNRDKKLADKTLVTVYNLEVLSNHTYFVGNRNILVHNGCSKKKYFDHLESHGLIFESKEGFICIKFEEKDLPGFLVSPDDEDVRLELNRYGQIIVPNHILDRLKRMGFMAGGLKQKIGRLELAIPMSRLEYEAIFPFIRHNNYLNTPRKILEAAKKAWLTAWHEERHFLYRSILDTVKKFYYAKKTDLLTEREVLSTQQEFKNYFIKLSNKELHDFLGEKNDIWLAHQKKMQGRFSDIFPAP